MIVYFNGRFMPKDEVRISPDDRGFTFADGTYEVVRIYRGRTFRLEGHLRRLKASLDAMRLADPGVDRLEGIAEELVGKNALAGGEGSLYVQITRGVAPRRHPFPDPAVPPTVYACVSPVTPALEKWRDGVSVILVPDIRWGRCDIKSVSLLANVLAAQQAKEAGAEESIFVRGGAVTEGTRTNAAAVFDGALVTHPVENAILNGITREAVLELCRSMDIPVREEPVGEKRFRSADEAMILGTSTEIMPVVAVDGRPVGNGLPGPVTRALQKAFYRLTRGAEFPV
jgi:D-alanine transaminase